MFDVKVSIYVYKLDEDQQDLLKVHGYVNDSQHIWEKVYEIDDIRDSMCKLLALLDDTGVSPYHIELDRRFYNLAESQNNFDFVLDK